MNESKRKTVLICDDETRTRQGLKALLFAREIAQEEDSSPAIQVVGEAQHGSEAVRMVEILQPEVVIMDACMPGIGGMEATRQIKRKWPQVKIVMLTMYPDTRVAAQEAGVDAYLLKGCPAETLFDAILDESLPDTHTINPESGGKSNE
jgi:DNA-binding NarL/FixJ family response regulator